MNHILDYYVYEAQATIWIFGAAVTGYATHLLMKKGKHNK